MTTLCFRRNGGSAAGLLLGTLLLLLAFPVTADNGSRSRQFDFDIPRSTRVMAFHELTRQARGLVVGYLSSDDAEEIALVGPVKGRLSVDEVLRVLLRSSDLTSRWVDNSMVSVEPRHRAEGSKDSSDIVRTVPHSTDFDPSKGGEPEEVLVLGWPLRDLALSVAPVVVMEREDLDAIGAPTLPDALRYLSQSAYSRPEGYRSSGAQYAEMRGLGPDTALVLINGRRALPSANSLASSAFDLNTIPVPAVDRVEFLLDSAAAAYGSDAIGGVINIVLRDRVRRPTLELRYGGAEGGAQQERVTFSAGLNKDRFHGAVVFDYFNIGGLLGSQRSMWLDQDFRRYGGRDRRTLVSSPGNVSSSNGANLPGLSAPIAGVPSSDPTPGVTLDDFVATAGQPNMESLLRFSSIVPEANRRTVTATGTANLTDTMIATGEVLYVDRSSNYYFSPPVLADMPVPASTATVPGNPYNPFGTTVTVNRLLTEYPSQKQSFESDLLRWAVALHGDWGAWNWEVSALRSDEHATTELDHALGLTAAMRALANPNPSLALNPFSAEPIGSPELLDSLLLPRDVDEFSSGGQQVAGFLQGPVWVLPAGPLTTVIGGEWRSETMRASNEAPGTFDHDREVIAGFAQVRVPVISSKPGMQRPGLHELTFTGGTRWDGYSEFGRVLRSQLGLLWKPHRDFSVRASGGSSFRPPSLYEMFLPRISLTSRVTDPVRGELATAVFTMGGNSELEPATARSLTAGVQFHPDSAWNWNISADWWRIDMKNRVVAVPLQVMLANEALFSDRIVRDPPTEVGRPGVLRAVDTSRINVGGVKVAGVDVGIKADFQTDLGRFTPELQATWFDRFESTDVPGQAPVERVDLASELGSILDWRAILSLKWRRGPFGAAAFARYTPSYDDATAGVRTGRTIAAQTLIDLQGSLDLGNLYGDESRLDGVRLWLGAVNVFGEAPNYADVGDLVGFDSSQSELKERTYYLRLEKKF